MLSLKNIAATLAIAAAIFVATPSVQAKTQTSKTVTHSKLATGKAKSAVISKKSIQPKIHAKASTKLKPAKVSTKTTTQLKSKKTIKTAVKKPTKVTAAASKKSKISSN